MWGNKKLLLWSVLIDVIHKVTMFAIFPINEYCAVTVADKNIDTKMKKHHVM